MLERFTDGVWFDTGPVRILGTHLSATMTVLRLEEGLVVHSPLPLTAERQASVAALGKVTHLYAPNTFHHLWLGDWSHAFPEARVHAPEGLEKKRADLRIDRHTGEDAAFGDELTEIPIDGFRLRETALLHQPSRTLVVTDLVHNIGRPEGTWTKLYTSMMGFYDRVALSRVLRWTAFDDRAAARRSVDQLLEQPFEGLVVGHGLPIGERARELFADAMRFLPQASAPALPHRPKRAPLLSAKPCG
jgi:hypothetical protein